MYLVNKHLCLLLIPVVPGRLVYLNNFLGYHVKDLDGGNTTSATFHYSGRSDFFSHSAVVHSRTLEVSVQSVTKNRDARVVTFLEKYKESMTAIDYKMIEVVEGILKLILYVLSVEYESTIEIYLNPNYISV